MQARPAPAIEFVQELFSVGYLFDSGPVSMIGVQGFERFGKLGEAADSSAVGGARLEADIGIPSTVPIGVPPGAVTR